MRHHANPLLDHMRAITLVTKAVLLELGVRPDQRREAVVDQIGGVDTRDESRMVN